MKLEQFKKGYRVKYIPNHAEGDENHSDCKEGVVSSVNDSWVFVKYDNLEMRMQTGDEPYTAQATDPEDLILGSDSWRQFISDNYEKGLRVITKSNLGSTMGMTVHQRHCSARKPNKEGDVGGWVPGHGGDLWWVNHDDGTVGVYMFDEFELAPPSPPKKTRYDMLEVD